MPDSMVAPSEPAAPPTVIRRLTRIHELREAFALRYEVYSREGWIARAYDSTATRLELDGCDRTSLHLGLFLRDGGDRLAGYVRLITLRPQGCGAAAAAIVARACDSTLRHAYASTYSEGLPVFASFPLGEFRRQLHARRLTYLELSRLIVREEFRRWGFGARLVEEGLTLAARRGFDVVLIGCGLSRVTMFQRLGFDLLATPILNYQRIDQPSRALWCRVGPDRSQTGGCDD